MINTSVNKNEHTIQSGVVDYPIGFPFYFNPDRTPQLLVKIGDEELRFNHNFELSEDKGSVVLRPTEEESWTLEGPEDFSWMAKWDGKDLLIERVVPFVQDSDYQLGRISSEQIERDFDLSVMRDQALDSKIKKLRNDMVDEFVATDSRIDSIQEQMADEFRNVRDEFAEADKGLSNKIDEAKAELQENIDDKLPLTGGTLTGPLTIEGDGFASNVLSLKHRDSGALHKVFISETGVQISAMLYGMHSIRPSQFDGPHSLGTVDLKWDTVYAKKISNGANILIPEKAGTMALLEDVEGKADKAELSNYLPLSGGSFMASWIGFGGTFSPNENRGIITVQTASGVKGIIGAATDENGKFKDVVVIDKLKGTTTQYSTVLATQVGSINSHVPRVFAKKIGSGNSNKMIVIPEKAGTMACLDDIPETYTKEELDAKFAEIPDSADTYSKAEIDAKLSSVYKFKGSVANVEALPSGATVGDTYNVEDTGDNYAWDGSAWDKLAGTVDLTGYATEEYVDDTAFALMDYIDDEIRPLRTDNKNLYNNQLVLRDMLNEKDENGEFIKLTTEAQSAIPAINELNAKIGEGGGGDYLPLSGGTLTGVLGFEFEVPKLTYTAYFLSLKRYWSTGSSTHHLGYDGTNIYLSYLGLSQVGNIKPGQVGCALGGEHQPWKIVYAESIINGTGGALIVPTEGGTLARLEDLEGLGGGGGLSDKLGFNTSAGYLYFGDISGVEDFVGFDAPALTADISGGALSIVNRANGELDEGEMYRFADDGFRAGEYATGKKLGSDEVPWMTTYTAFISAGLGAGELELPTEEGTIARIEDIDERIGDISTALTAILGE